MKRLFPILFFIRDTVCLGYYRWALAEISPLHPDVPRIVHRIHQLEREQPWQSRN